MKTPTSSIQLIRNKPFRLYLIACFFLYLLSQFYYIVQVTMIIELTQSTVILGTVLMVMAIPRLIVIPLGGILVDRFKEKVIFITGYSALVLILLSLGILIWFDYLTIQLIFLYAVLFGISSAIILPATYSIIPKLVDADHLQKANALVQFLNQFSFFVGPAIAGLLLGVIDLSLFILLMAGLIALSLIFVTRLKLSPTEQEGKPQKSRNSFWEFFDVLKVRIIFLLVIFTSLLNLSVIGPQQVGLPVLAEVDFNLGAEGLSLLLTAFGLGSIIGVILTGLLPAKYITVSIMGMITCCFGIVWSGFSWVNNMWVVLLLIGAAGLFVSTINILFITLLQKASSEASQGKVMSLVFLGSAGLQPVSQFMTGVLISATSVQIMYLIAGCLVVSFSIVLMMAGKRLKHKSPDGRSIEAVEEVR